MTESANRYPPESRTDIEALPPALPKRLDDELDAGNVQYQPDRDGYPEGWRPPPPPDPTLMARFQASRAMNAEKWREGEGFDLEALRAMTPTQQNTIAATLIPPAGWREVEALAVIGDARAHRALRAAAREEPLQVRLAVAHYAPELVTESMRVAMLTEALRSAQIMTGLSEALDQIEDFHPPAVVRALFRGLLKREGEVAYHCAEMLAVIHGAIPSRYDWSLRPLFLRFTADDPTERRAALAELQLLLASRPLT